MAINNATISPSNQQCEGSVIKHIATIPKSNAWSAETDLAASQKLFDKYTVIREQYASSPYREMLRRTLAEETWNVDRILIVGLGTDLWQLAQIWDVLEYLFSLFPPETQVSVLAQDPCYEPGNDRYSKPFNDLLELLHVGISTPQKFDPDAGIAFGAARAKPASDLITKTTFVYTPYAPMYVHPYLLQGVRPAGWLGNCLDGALAHVEKCGKRWWKRSFGHESTKDVHYFMKRYEKRLDGMAWKDASGEVQFGSDPASETDDVAFAFALYKRVKDVKDMWGWETGRSEDYFESVKRQCANGKC